ncbi:TonB-dependent receptor plug domain-containing protein [Thiomicrospira microaerophila]|uniref:TonB-dependent receptor plug domain-containing protein n=1 Tax=Thiomicrospira microaerophila TaxID=406020 RepID=UPI0005C86E5A|nr:TonB-dependent receptor [Thiomicrospira microaerophila]
MLTTATRFKIKPLIAVLCLSPGLAIADNPLSQIVVTASNTEQTERSVTANMSVITRKEIEAKQYQTLTEALTSVPGVSLSLSGGLGHASSVFIRGSNRVLVLLNGVPLNDPTSINNTALFESMQLSDVERIEIVRGGQSSIWGANAAAGVINIISRQTEHPHQVEASLTRGNHGYQQLATTLGVRNEQADFTYHFSNTQSDGFSQMKPYKGDETQFERDGFDQTDVSLAIGINPTKNQRLVAFVKNSDMQADYDSNWSGGPDDDASTRSINTQVRQLNYQIQLDQVQVKAWVNETDLERNEAGWLSAGKQNQKALQIESHYANNANAHIILAENNSESESSNLKINNKTIGLYNQNQFNRLTLNQALRHDEYNAFQDKTTGRLGAGYQINPAIRLFANIGTAYTAPTLFQLTQGTTENLKPEETQDWDIRLEAWGLGITYFKSEVRNMIDYGSSGTWDIDYTDFYYNLNGKSKFSGWEIDYARDLKSLKTQLELQFTQLEAKDDQGKTLARRPEQSASMDLRFYGVKDTQINWHTRYIGTKYDYRSNGTQQIGEYFVSDLTASYALTKHIDLQAKVKNLFDEDYTDAVETATGSTPDIVYANGGRQFFVGIRAGLK